MAIKIHDYFKHFRTKTVLSVIALQTVSVAIAAIISAFLWTDSTNPQIHFMWSVFIFLVINVVGGMIIVVLATKPFGILAQAIAHVSNDPVVTPPPTIATSYEHSGLNGLVQTVYNLAVAAHPEGKTQATSATANDLFAQIAERLPCGVIALDTKNAIVYANPNAPIADTPSGKTISLNFEVSNDIPSWLADCRANKVRDTKLWLRVADKLPGEDNRRIFDVIGHYQKQDASGIEVVLAMFDRTAVYATAQEDMDFIALAAHELRGPITVIRGYLDVLNDELAPTLDPESKQLLDRLQVSSERLSGYVNNILNVSRYDRHQFKIHRQEEKLTDIVATLIPDLALRARTQKRTLSVSIPGNLPTIAADRTSLGEVITNLADNAIKYSHQDGNVAIRAQQKDNFIEVTVQDTGIGMPSAVVGNLFNRFYRSHRSKQAVAGTGLGLYICKAIVEAHEGTIWVRSVEGQGSTFGFNIPTYASVAANLKNGDNEITQRAEGWIKNHAMFRG